MKHHGFSLIELLVVLAIMGVITATTVPQYSAYKKRAFDTRARVDLYNVATAEEAYFSEAEHYLDCAGDECKALPGITGLSDGVQLTITGTESGFTGTSSHKLGSGKQFKWDSNQGGFLG